MRIALTTPAGHVGSHLTRALVRTGCTPILLTRRPDLLDPALSERVEPRSVDLYDVEAVVRATVDVDALYWVDPSPTGSDPLADHARAATSAVAAIERNTIHRVVFQSSVGAELRHGAGEIDGLAATEIALESTGVDVTHLRCGYFFTNLLFQLDALRAGTIQVIVPTDAPMPWVAPLDIAEVAATRLLDPSWSGRHVHAVHGPADLSWTDVARILSRTLGRAIAVERISDDTMRAQFSAVGIPPLVADGMIGMSTGLRDGFVPEQPRTPMTTTDTTLRAWTDEQLRPVM